MKKYNKAIGNTGETLAKDFLLRNGFKIRDLNYRCPLGEIDIIAFKNDILCFVEVKARYYLNYGFPMEAVTQKNYIEFIKYVTGICLKNL